MTITLISQADEERRRLKDQLRKDNDSEDSDGESKLEAKIRKLQNENDKLRKQLAERDSLRKRDADLEAQAMDYCESKHQLEVANLRAEITMLRGKLGLGNTSVEMFQNVQFTARPKHKTLHRPGEQEIPQAARRLQNADGEVSFEMALATLTTRNEAGKNCEDNAEGFAAFCSSWRGRGFCGKGAAIPDCKAAAEAEGCGRFYGGLLRVCPKSCGECKEGASLKVSADDMKLTGTIPTGIGKFTQLEQIKLEGHNIRGSLPSELGNISGMTLLNLATNKLTGTIPSELGKLSSLSELNLQNNVLTGSICTGITWSIFRYKCKWNPEIPGG